MVCELYVSHQISKVIHIETGEKSDVACVNWSYLAPKEVTSKKMDTNIMNKQSRKANGTRYAVS